MQCEKKSSNALKQKDMKQVTFTDEFYKQLYNELLELCECYENEEDSERVEEAFGIELDNYNIGLNISMVFEYEDNSFNHEFGTYIDENAGYLTFKKIEKVSDVHVYDEDGEVAGFDYEKFNKLLK